MNHRYLRKLLFVFHADPGLGNTKRTIPSIALAKYIVCVFFCSAIQLFSAEII